MEQEEIKRRQAENRIEENYRIWNRVKDAFNEMTEFINSTDKLCPVCFSRKNLSFNDFGEKIYEQRCNCNVDDLCEKKDAYIEQFGGDPEKDDFELLAEKGRKRRIAERQSAAKEKREREHAEALKREREKKAVYNNAVKEFDQLKARTCSTSLEYKKLSDDFKILSIKFKNLTGENDTASIYYKQCLDKSSEFKDKIAEAIIIEKIQEANQKRRQNIKGSFSIFLMLCIMAAFFYLLYGTDIIVNMYFAVMGPDRLSIIPIFSRLSLITLLISILFAVVSRILCSKSGYSLFGILSLVILILVTVITMGVWDGIGFDFLTVVLNSVFLALPAAPAALFMFTNIA